MGKEWVTLLLVYRIYYNWMVKISIYCIFLVHVSYVYPNILMKNEAMLTSRTSITACGRVLVAILVRWSDAAVSCPHCLWSSCGLVRFRLTGTEFAWWGSGSWISDRHRENMSSWPRNVVFATQMFSSDVHPSCCLSSRCFMCNKQNKFDPALSQFVRMSWQQHVLVVLIPSIFRWDSLCFAAGFLYT